MRNTVVQKIWLEAWFGVEVATATVGTSWLGSASWAGIVAIASLNMAASAQAAPLAHWQFNPATQQLEVVLPKGTTPRYFLAAEPARIILDLPNTEVGSVPTQQTYDGAVRQIRIAQFEPGLTRIVLELAPGTLLAPQQVELKSAGAAAGQSGDRWVLRPLLAGNASAPVATATPAPSGELANAAPVPAPPAPPASATPADIPPSPDSPSDAASSAAATSSATAGLPPLEPGATEIPVETPTSETAQVPTPSTPAATAATAPKPASTPSTPASMPAPAASVPEAPPAPDQADSTATTPPPAFSRTGSAPESSASAQAASMTAAPPPASSPQAESAPEPKPEPKPERTAAAPGAIDALPPASASASATASSPGGDRPATVSVPSVNQAASTPASASASPSSTTSPLLPPRLAAEDPSTPSVASAAPLLTATASSLPPSSSPSPAMSPTPPPIAPSSTGMVSVPSIQSIAPPPSAASSAAAPGRTPDRTPDRAANNRAANNPAANSPVPPAPASPTPPANHAVEFGQPMPAGAPTSLITTPPNGANTGMPSANVLLPSGTVLNLRYSGETPLALAAGQPQQEVLVLAEPVRDSNGNVILPEGSQVIGRFETGSGGSRFVTQAISWQGQNMELNAQSEHLSGERQVSKNNILRNSALGGAAGILLGGLTGIGLIPAIIAGAASTAATTYVTAPQPAVIQPNQIVEVRLTDDVSYR